MLKLKKGNDYWSEAQFWAHGPCFASPGDIVVQGRSTTFYFPIVTCLLLSLVLSLVLWMVSLLRR